MKSKIILVVILLISLVMGITLVAKATDDLEVRTNINLEDMVGEDDNSEDFIDPISLDVENFIDMSAYEEDELQRGDVYVLDKNASVEEYVDGNLYVLSNNADISAYVDGNVFVMGKNVTIKGNVTGSLFIFGENVNFLSGYAKDAYICADNIVMAEEATISREAKMVGSTISISGVIDGNVYASAEQINVIDTGYISGKLTYAGEVSSTYEDQIGSLEKREVNVAEKVTQEKTIANKAESILFKTVTALVIIGLIVLASDKKTEGNITVSDCVKGVLAGIGWIILIPVIVVLLMLTIVGLPASIILLMTYILMFFVAIPAVSLQVSAYILNAKNKNSKALLWLLAVVIYCAVAILKMIPTVGFIISVLLGTYGFNLIIKTLFAKKKKEVSVEPTVAE